MADIIPFPKKENFIKNFGGDLPDDYKECLSKVYDEVLKINSKIPVFNITLPNNEQGNEIKKIINAYKAVVLEALSELMKEKASACERI